MINVEKVKNQKKIQTQTFLIGIILVVLGVIFLFATFHILRSIIIIFLSIVVIAWSINRKKLIEDFEELTEAISSNAVCSLQSISTATNKPIDDIKREIKKLIELGYFKDVYLDEANNCLIQGKENTNINTFNNVPAENSADEELILTSNKIITKIKLTSKKISVKDFNREKTFMLSEIDYAGLDVQGVFIKLNDKLSGRQIKLSGISNDQYYTWVDTINKMLKGDNFTPLPYQTVTKVIEKRKIAFCAIIAALVVTVFAISSFPKLLSSINSIKKNNNSSQSDKEETLVLDSDEQTIADVLKAYYPNRYVRVVRGCLYSGSWNLVIEGTGGGSCYIITSGMLVPGISSDYDPFIWEMMDNSSSKVLSDESIYKINKVLLESSM